MGSGGGLPRSRSGREGDEGARWRATGSSGGGGGTPGGVLAAAIEPPIQIRSGGGGESRGEWGVRSGELGFSLEGIWRGVWAGLVGWPAGPSGPVSQGASSLFFVVLFSVFIVFLFLYFLYCFSSFKKNIGLI